MRILFGTTFFYFLFFCGLALLPRPTRVAGPRRRRMSPFLSGCLDTLHEGGVGLDSASALCSKLAALEASPLESLEEEPSHFASFDKPEDWMNLSVALCCMLMAATASGLTMGVVSLDELELRVKERNVNESKTERGCASGATCREAAPQTAADAATLHGPARTGGLAG